MLELSRNPIFTYQHNLPTNIKEELVTGWDMELHDFQSPFLSSFDRDSFKHTFVFSKCKIAKISP